ncbi:MAG TPA: phosphoribosylanthranilate isomerase [Pyrinomonadaceae bacterium]
MKPTTNPRVKICCIASIEEAWTAIDYGASAVGLVSQMPSGPGVISDELIEEIAAMIPPAVSSFLLTCSQDVDDIIKQQTRLRVNTIQICDRLDKGNHRELRQALPGVSIVQVVHVTGAESVEEALEAAPFVDALLLDSGSKTATIKELGGTGRVHDWSLSKLIRQEVKVPVFLAGGLNSANVAAAIREVRPFGVDVCSGVRTDNHLDEKKMADFFRAVTQAQLS